MARALLYNSTMPRETHLHPLLAALLVWTAALGACSLRPQPEPPPAEPQLLLDNVSAVPSHPNAMQGGSISGAPGAAPPGATLRAYNLDNNFPPSVTAANDDGSFELLIDIIAGDEVRIQAITQDARSKPLDVIIGEPESTPTLAVRPLADCVSLAPASELSFGTLDTSAERSLIVANACDFDIEIGALGMRRPLDGLLIDSPALPASIPSGSSRTWTIRMQPPVGATGEIEDVLLVEVDAPERDRRPVTIRADLGD